LIRYIIYKREKEEKAPCFARDRYILFLVKKIKGAIIRKGCACPGKTGKPKLSDMAPTWLIPGIKNTCTARAGDFSKCLIKATESVHQDILYNCVTSAFFERSGQ
jgi:hypothetical protein